MRDEHWFNWAALVGILLVVVIGGFAIALTAGAAAPAGPASTPTAPKVDYLYLTVSFNTITGKDQYFPANFSVPAHTLVVITVTSYDNGTNLVPAGDQTVRGTVGNTAQVWANGASTPTTMTSVAANAIAHTFTIQQGLYNLNVPIPATVNMLTPSVIQFSTYFNETGSYQWACLAPCDPGSMTTPGFMTGTLTVV